MAFTDKLQSLWQLMEIGKDLYKDEAHGRSYNHGQGRINGSIMDAAIPGRAVFWAQQKCTVGLY